MICRLDAEILDFWVEHGIPDDQSTRQAALDLLLKVWADYQEYRRAVDQVLSGSALAAVDVLEGQLSLEVEP